MTAKDEFCELIRAHEKSMNSLAFSIVRNESDAAEVISESIYRAYKNLANLKAKNSFKPWILSIVHNTAVETVRKDCKVVTANEIIDVAYNSHEEDITINHTIRNAVENLKQPYRTVVILFYYEDLSIAKIAQITGSNIVAVKKQLSRARNLLRQILKEDFK